MPFMPGPMSPLRKLLLVTGLALGFSVILFANVQAECAKRLDREIAQLNDALVELQRAAGYGGFIHNFKNYILRPTEITHRIVATEKLDRMAIEIDRIDAIAKVTGVDFDLGPVRDVIDAYRAALVEVDELAAADLSAREIDRQVWVDDSHAVGASNAVADLIRARVAEAEARIDQWTRIIGSTLAALTLLAYMALAAQIAYGDRPRFRSGRASD